MRIIFTTSLNIHLAFFFSLLFSILFLSLNLLIFTVFFFQSGHADGYLLEGKELEFYAKKMDKKKNK